MGHGLWCGLESRVDASLEVTEHVLQRQLLRLRSPEEREDFLPADAYSTLSRIVRNKHGKCRGQEATCLPELRHSGISLRHETGAKCGELAAKYFQQSGLQCLARHGAA